MVQNISHAVMAQRQPSSDTFDFYPTPSWATRALCVWLSAKYDLVDYIAWDPACGAHDMAVPLSEYFQECRVSDIVPYENRFGDVDHQILDFLKPTRQRADFIITNPPFVLAEEFALKAIERATTGVALLTRTTFLETIGRHDRLFTKQPPTDILQFSERVVMHKGKLSKTGSTATAYCWVIWLAGHMHPTIFHWIPPCRAELERDEDYPD